MKERGLEENHASNFKTYKTCMDKTTDKLFNRHGDAISKYLLNFS